jgi:hypothetical protein
MWIFIFPSLVQMFDLGNKRYASVREFRGKALIDVREYYLDNKGELKPGKKGIALSTAQWAELKKKIPEIDRKLKE